MRYISWIIFIYISTSNYEPSRAESSRASSTRTSAQLVCNSNLSAPEAVWRIFGFKLHHRSPAIHRLQIHLLNQQTVTFDNDTNIVTLLQNERLRKTILIEYFTANEQAAAAIANGEVLDFEFLYQEFPMHDLGSQKSSMESSKEKRQDDRTDVFCCSQWRQEILFADAPYNRQGLNIVRRFTYMGRRRSTELQISMHYTWTPWLWWVMGSFPDWSSIMARWISIVWIVCLYSATLSTYRHASVMEKSCRAFIRWLSPSIANNTSDWWTIRRTSMTSF